MRLYQIVENGRQIALVWAALPEQAEKYAQDNFGRDAHAQLVPQVGGVG